MLHSPCPMVVTVHDLAALKRRSEHLRAALRLRLRQLAVQRAVRRDRPDRGGRRRRGHAARRRARAGRRDPRGRRPVDVPAAASEEIAAVRERLGLPERYLVWVGRPAAPRPGKHIAAAGGRDAASCRWCWSAPTRPWAHELPDVILTGEVSDEELAAIYSGAHALVLSSESEGFGLPARRGARLRHARSPPARRRRCARCSATARHVRRPGDMQALVGRPRRPPRGPRRRRPRGPGRTPRGRPGASTRPRAARARHAGTARTPAPAGARGAASGARRRGRSRLSRRRAA